MPDNELIAAYLLVLKQNTKIVFNDGDWLQGDTKTGYLDHGCGAYVEPSSLGLWNLDEDGIKSALKDLDQIRQDLGVEDED